MTKEAKVPVQGKDSEKPMTEQVVGGQTEGAKGEAKPEAVKPEPKVKAKAAPEGEVTIVVVGPAKGRWRAGRHFGPEPTQISLEELTKPQLEALRSDPELVVSGAA